MVPSICGQTVRVDVLSNSLAAATPLDTIPWGVPGPLALASTRTFQQFSLFTPVPRPH